MATLVKHTCDNDEKIGVSIIDFPRFCELSGSAHFSHFSPLCVPHVSRSRAIYLACAKLTRQETGRMAAIDDSLYRNRIFVYHFLAILYLFLLTDKIRYVVNYDTE